MAEFDRVRTKYGYDSTKPQRIKNWYIGNLDTIAEKAGYKAEYEIVQKLVNEATRNIFDNPELEPQPKQNRQP